MSSRRAPGRAWKTAAGDHYLEPVSIAKADVHVSDGKESAQELTVNTIREIPQGKSLHTEGAFGPILAAVLVALAKPESKLMWARWEEGYGGPLAVFRYNIPRDTPIFKVEYCCLAVDFDQIKFETYAPTYGEIAVDPATGAILRFTMRAGLAWRLPLQHSDITIEYGPVILGGASYICPIRSVSISRPRSVVEISEFGETFRVNAPFENILNDVKYENYHLSRPLVCCLASTNRRMPNNLPSFVPGHSRKSPFQLSCASLTCRIFCIQFAAWPLFANPQSTSPPIAKFPFNSTRGINRSRIACGLGKA